MDWFLRALLLSIGIRSSLYASAPFARKSVAVERRDAHFLDTPSCQGYAKRRFRSHEPGGWPGRCIPRIFLRKAVFMKQFNWATVGLLAVLGLLLLAPCNSTQAEQAGTATDKQAEPITPKGGMIRLFNGQDLTGLYTWIRDTGYDDPRKVFTVHDGLLHISGDGYGYVTTRQEYRDYRLVAEFKWGTRTWGDRKTKSKDSGILVHCVGPDGNQGNWMASIEAQIIEGGIGDILVLPGKYADGSAVPSSITCELRTDADGKVHKDAMGVYWKKGGPKQTFNKGRVNWYGRDPDWKDVLGIRGKLDVESRDGEWNKMEVICDGGHITNIVNGIVVNEGFDAFPTAGKIIFQTEGAEILFRKIELWPLAAQ
jgi:hypothetical protein